MNNTEFKFDPMMTVWEARILEQKVERTGLQTALVGGSRL